MTIGAVGATLLGRSRRPRPAFLFSLSEGLEDYSLARTRHGLRALLDLVPRQATVLRDGDEVVVAPDELILGRPDGGPPGERSPPTASSAPDAPPWTPRRSPASPCRSRSAPARRCTPARSTAPAVLEVEVTTTAEDNSLARIVNIVEAEQSRKGSTQRLADRIAKPLVPGILILAALIAVAGRLLGDPAAWLERALVMLVAASPCALAISVPVTVVAAIGAASRCGILVKGGAALEALGKVRTVALDKTGTLTRNQPAVIEVAPPAASPASRCSPWRPRWRHAASTRSPERSWPPPPTIRPPTT